MFFMYPQRNWFEIKRNEKREHDEIHENKRKKLQNLMRNTFHYIVNSWPKNESLKSQRTELCMLQYDMQWQQRTWVK